MPQGGEQLLCHDHSFVTSPLEHRKAQFLLVFADRLRHKVRFISMTAHPQSCLGWRKESSMEPLLQATTAAYPYTQAAIWGREAVPKAHSVVVVFKERR